MVTVEHNDLAVSLATIADRIEPIVTLGDPTGVAISGVVYRDSAVEAGSLYCCLPGQIVDGHTFAGKARRAGASAFICEHSLSDLDPGAIQLVVGPGEARRAMALAACAFYGDPASALQTVGVTGTNGKTTTTFLIRAILEEHGWTTGVVGTLDGARTTPEAPELQRALAGFRDRGASAAALEVTSHALVQGRVDGIHFDVAVFTNLSQDHLDFHHTMDAYFAAKSILFTPERATCAVVNLDDPYGRRLAERQLVETVTYSIADAVGLELGSTSSRFRLAGRPVELHLGGEFNVANALAAAAAARALGVDEDTIVRGLEVARGVPGRFETIESFDGVTVVVDYAHTPAALDNVLRSARLALEATASRSTRNSARAPRVHVVFGAGGDRDRGKRPGMGAIATRLSDVVVVTSDNPRSEDPAAIADQVVAGMRDTTNWRIELDRRAAIASTLAGARSGDVVVIAGRGHETTQQFADSTVHFDDRTVVREELERQGRALPNWARPVEGERAR
jgi:UDP-N-acetylmuramoyl-L-alanyl-D-glutamate--2,6-diaminopimelate ligase